MKPLLAAALEFETAFGRCLPLLGGGPSSQRLRDALTGLRRIVARLALAGVDELPDADPVAAVVKVTEMALAAGADWREIAAAVNRTRMPGGQP